MPLYWRIKMKFKPHLLVDLEKGAFKFVYIDPDEIGSKQSSFDNLETIQMTKNSPIKKIIVGYTPSLSTQ